MTKEGELSPSAFIPFCEFGGNMSAVGIKIKQFDVPVCNSFQAKILNDQLCYEVDLNSISRNSNRDLELGLGFNFLLDYNEDRQKTFDRNITKKFSLTGEDQSDHAVIYLNTVGKYQYIIVQ